MKNNDTNNVVSFKEKRKQYKKKKAAKKGVGSNSSNVDWKVYLQVILFLAILAFAMQQC